MENKEIHYNAVQTNKAGQRFVLCKNCREPVLIGDAEPYLLGVLCSTTCLHENAEHYR